MNCSGRAGAVRIDMRVDVRHMRDEDSVPVIWQLLLRLDSRGAPKHAGRDAQEYDGAIRFSSILHDENLRG